MSTTGDDLGTPNAPADSVGELALPLPTGEPGHFAHWGAKIQSSLRALGPGLVTGASDDDPSGIATYSQVGAQFGYGMLWTMLFSYPLMTAIQEICARVGRVTGCGISANLRRCYPRWVLRSVITLVLVANIFNLGADIGAMGAAAQLLLPARTWIYILLFGFASLLLQVLVPYTQYVRYLKWLTLSLFAYVVAAFFVRLPWAQVLHATLLPRLTWDKDYLTGLIAVLGTTISPYLFFWQASQEVEEVKNNRGEKPLKRAHRQASAQWNASELTPTWHGTIQCRRLLYHSDHRCHLTRSWQHQCRNRGSGCTSPAAPRWAMGRRALCMRNHWYRDAGHTGLGRISRVCHGRGLQMAGQPGEKTGAGSGLLSNHRRGDDCRHRT